MHNKNGINDPNYGREIPFTHADYGDVTFNKSPFLTEWVDKYIDGEVKTILDIGALDGGDSLRFNSWYPNAEVFAIEGSPHNFDVLNKKLGVRKNLKTFNYVMSDKNGMVDFHRTVYDDKMSDTGYMVMGTIYTLKESKIRQHNLRSVDSVRVESVSFDTFCEMNGITEVDVAHVDIEGASYDMVMGMNKVLPKLIFMEQEGSEFFTDKLTGGNVELKKLMTEKGYDLVLDMGNDFLYVKKD
jgi:FkbM family methyltransferase|tara:strand:- start:554 stop:1279 length:726 start_codon:yes stop_codon:yes gene_type:complete